MVMYLHIIIIISLAHPRSLSIFNGDEARQKYVLLDDFNADLGVSRPEHEDLVGRIGFV
mgnify:FL=1